MQEGRKAQDEPAGGEEMWKKPDDRQWSRMKAIVAACETTWLREGWKRKERIR